MADERPYRSSSNRNGGAYHSVDRQFERTHRPYDQTGLRSTNRNYNRFDSRERYPDPPRGPRRRENFFDGTIGDYHEDNKRRYQGRVDPRRHQDPTSRKRSRSPGSLSFRRPVTPDLSSVRSIHDRKRKHSLWDIRPQGYEQVTADQAKLSGLFALPGAPRQVEADPEKMVAFMAQPGVSKPLVTLKPALSRQARRLILSDVPSDKSDSEIKNIINGLIQPLNISPPAPSAVTWARSDAQRQYMMLEFREAEQATVLLGFNGMEVFNMTLKLRRVKDYVTPVTDDGESQVRERGGVPETSAKLIVSNLPPHLEQEQGRDLLSTFGELKSFFMVKDRVSGDFRGILLAEYLDESIAETAIDGLQGMDLGGFKIQISRACIGITQIDDQKKGPDALVSIANHKDGKVTSRVLQVMNAASTEEILDEKEVKDIEEDISAECVEYGRIIDIKIPKPPMEMIDNSVAKVCDFLAGTNRQIFVRFEDLNACSRALHALAGRRYNDRSLLTAYFPEESYAVDAW